MPAISSGIFGFPKDKCAEIMIDSAWEFASTIPAGIAEIRFTNIDNQTVEIFRKALSLKIQYNNK
jgi:O-acetyl-ADP-ribose deacetylase (regulator of RNase III)